MKNYFLIFATILLLFISCDKDQGTEPTSQSAVEGTITFTGAWPTQPSEVRLVSATNFPLSDINDLQIGESIPVDAATYDFTSHLEPATYKFFGVIWRTDNDWDLANICGIYFSESDSLLPAEITLANKDSKVQGVDIVVNRSKAKLATGSQIVGTINFDGSWPVDITSAMIVASTKNPLTNTFTLLDLNIGGAIARGTTSFEYSISVSPTTYKAISILFYKGTQPLTIDDLYYSQNIGALVVEDIVVGENQIVDGPDFDVHIGPVLSGIQGTLTFQGEWPDAAEEVRLVMATKFPPEFEEVIIGDSIPSNVSKHEYTFNIKPDTYKLVGVAWRAEGTEWDLLSICGFYLSKDDSLAPAEVIIPDDTTVIRGINMVVNRSKARKITDTKITGSITFTGTWPEDISEARVIASTKFKIDPPMELPTLLDLGFSETIAPGTTEYNYEIKAFPGTFEAAAVIFFKEGQTLSIDDIFYSSQVGGLDLTPFNVEENATANGPDFTIQFY